MSNCGPAGGTLAVALLLFGTSACGVIGGGDTPACALPSPPSGAADPVELKVTEQGFTQIGPPPAKVSMGAVVENNGTRVAYRTVVTFRARNSRGGDAVAKSARPRLVEEIPIIRPGERVVVGAAVPVGPTDPSGDAPARATRMSVQANASGRIEPSGFAAVTTKLTTGRSGRSDDGSTQVDFQMTSGWCGNLVSRGTAVVFRDRHGAIVGGDTVNVASAGGCDPGTTAQEVTTAEKSVPAHADLDRTQVTPLCDLNKPAPGATATGIPSP
jgi:hypothetical protein